MKSTYVTDFLVIIVSLLVTSCRTPGPDSSAIKPLDHFLCYKAVSHEANAFPLNLKYKDQFSPKDTKIDLHDMDNRFCNPVEKKHGDTIVRIEQRDHHLHAITAVPDAHIIPGTSRGKVRITNQFYPQGTPVTVHRGSSEYFMVPTHKISMRPQPNGWQAHAKPKNLSHFKCYPAESDVHPTIPRVDLKDQQAEYLNTRVGRLALLCNPASKTQGTANPVPKTPRDAGSKDHLACFNVFNSNPGEVVYGIKNDLLTSSKSYSTTELVWLCTPSTKVKQQGWWGTGD